MSETSQDIIRNHMYWAIGAGSLPLPLIDLAAVTGIQLDMLKQLSRHYGVPYQEEQAKSWLSALSASLLSRLGANALKLIPGIGSILGGVSMAVLSGASTYALGQVAREHFEGRGSFEDLNLDEAQARYTAAYEDGKRVARSAKAEAPAPSADTVSKLERLDALHRDGVLTDAEFTAAKARLLQG
ncbi:MAG: DUF697 domain-containing protein [Myxococcales bacterium]|nr:DUF697 domain-containing protein [Myxococcales bacterium]